MTTAIVDTTDIEKKSVDASYVSKLNTAIGLDNNLDENNNADNFYYYSSGSFNFILDSGFKPETLEMVELTPVPFLPTWHKGIVSIHGVIMPVIDILDFAKNQNIEVTESKTNKSYLLKLEHEDYSPIVFILDTIPRVINTKEFKNIDTEQKTPTWIKNRIENDTLKLAFVSHDNLFNQLIKKQ